MDAAAVAALDKEYAQMAGEGSAATVRALEKEVQELETEVNKLTSGPSRRQALESEKEVIIVNAQKYEAVAETWKTKLNESEQALGDLEKELEAKVSDVKATTAENRDLLGQVGAQPLNVSDVKRMHREMKVVEDDTASAEKGTSALEEKDWELETKLVTKLDDLERLAEQCNQAHKRLKSGIDIQYMIHAKGSSPAEMLGTYKTVLKQGHKDWWLTLTRTKGSVSQILKKHETYGEISEKRHQDARLKADKETQAVANALRELVDSMAEHKGFMGTIIAQRRKDLHEAEDYIASLAS
ncbi:unnamed protein product, partial [Miscanthus lutarioriparius]